MKKIRTVAGVAGLALFGTFFSFIGETINLLFADRTISQEGLVAVKIFAPFIILLALLTIVYFIIKAKNFLPRMFGFLEISERWFPETVDERIRFSRELAFSLLEKDKFPVIIASVSGEWDICHPLTAKEIKKIFSSENSSIQILLCNPSSPELKIRCNREDGQDYEVMKSRILRNTKFLLESGGGKCDVRWYDSPILFHVFANADIMHFSPFVDGVPGHDARRYVVGKDNHLYKCLIKWFAHAWKTSSPPSFNGA